MVDELFRLGPCVYSLSSGRAPEARRQHAGRGADAAAPLAPAVVDAAAPPGRSDESPAASPGRDTGRGLIRSTSDRHSKFVFRSTSPFSLLFFRSTLVVIGCLYLGQFLHSPLQPRPVSRPGPSGVRFVGPARSRGCVDDRRSLCGCVRTPACVLAARLIPGVVSDLPDDAFASRTLQPRPTSA